ncbi:MAG TPA: amidohydrolase family protein [Bryobacteraceae bacterium]|nr:amidohydrolase family protein [Bryobacteraceae bacterium]
MTFLSDNAPRRSVNLAIIHGYVVTMDEHRRVFADGAVAIAGRDIVAVGPTAEILAQFEPARTIDAAGGVVHPGFVECHTHVTYHIARGAFGDTISYAELGPQTECAFVNAIDEDAEYASTLLACFEMVGNGTTCFIEAGTAYSPAAVATASEAFGMRGLVADPFLWDAEETPGGYNAYRLERAPASTKRALSLLGTELRRNRDPNALVGGHIAIAGMGTATDELERAAKAAADGAGTVLNQHQSYYQVDTETDDRRHGRHAILHLEDIGVLGENCLFSHMNVIREDEIEPIVRSGLSIAWCPAGSMLWGVGGTFHGRHAELYHRGVNIALGSDSANWSNRFDLCLQSYLAVLSAREKCGNRTILTAEDALAMATINGAKAVGLDARIGSLVPGKRADLVVRANDIAEAFPLTDPISQLVYSAGAKSVHTVLIDGRVVLEARRPTRVDPRSIFDAVETSVKRIFDRMGYRFQPNWAPLDQPGDR